MQLNLIGQRRATRVICKADEHLIIEGVEQAQATGGAATASLHGADSAAPAGRQIPNGSPLRCRARNSHDLHKSTH